MQQSEHKCYHCVGGNLECALCGSVFIKHGRTNKGAQRYKCKGCNKTCIEEYHNRAYAVSNAKIRLLVKEGCGIRSIARILSISATTVLRRILKAAKNIAKPIISFYKSYEVDEMRTYYKNKGRLLWIVMHCRKIRAQWRILQSVRERKPP